MTKKEVMEDFDENGVKEILESYMTNEHATEVTENYIRSLENIIIFFCQTYEEQEEVLFELAKEGNKALFEVPRIQGLSNTMAIKQLSEMFFEEPKVNLAETKEQIMKRKEGDGC